MSRVVRKILVVLALIVLLLVAVIAVYGIFTVRRSFPQVKGEVRIAGLDGPVDIYRDAYGIPHIYAASEHDLFFAQGYVHAQDRFWQMDFWRHTGSGRLSELLGAAPLDTDKFLRTLGWARVAEQELQTMDAESMGILNAYADGVNAYLATHNGSALSLEYAILPALNSGYQPEPWTPLHSLTWAKAMAWDLRGNMEEEIQEAVLLKTLTPEQVAELLPAYPSDAPIIVPAGNTGAAGTSSQLSALAGTFSPEMLAALETAAPRIRQLDALLGPAGTGIGSNNWVISGKRTSTGKPLLANDPHLSAQMPSIWYEIGLHCAPKGSACPYDVTGFSFAGDPGVIIGHNDRIAWGLTNVGPDVQDLYIEKINPENPNQYEVNGQWVDMQVVQETIQMAGGDPVPLTVRITRHGPIISDTYGKLEDFASKSGVAMPASYAIALRWTALEPAHLFNAIWQFNQAQNWEEFRKGAREFAVPAQNLVYADVDGNIGYQMPGRIPIRAAGDGRLPVPGWTDEYEWTGYIPFEELPFAYNPPQGYIATANNAVVGSDYPYLLSTDWDYGDRARRIVDMIENAPGPIDIAYIQKMQGDDRNRNAEALVPALLRMPLEDERLDRARALLQSWDFQDGMESAPAALFEAFWKRLLANTFHDEVPEAYWPSGGGRWYEVMRQLVGKPDSPWWDIRTTPAVEQRDDIFLQSLTEAVDELEASLGKQPERWNWGDLHTVTFRNATLGESGIAPIEALFNRGPFRTAGGSSIVNATSWDATSSYQVEALPSMRMIVDLSALENSLTVNTLGQSGHAYHPHYTDMVDLWRNIQYHPMLWERPQIEAAPEGHLRLLP